MKSTRWIAVAWLLCVTPVFSQTVDLPPSAATVNDAETAVTLKQVLSLEDEIEGLRRDIATTKTEREQAASEANQPLESETLATQDQRRELLELLTKLAIQKPQPPISPPAITAPPTARPEARIATRKPDAKPIPTAAHPLITDKIVDPNALGRALFRAGDYGGAEQAFRKVKVTDDNRVMLQYLIATCLRKQSKWEQAVKAYQIVSENKVDPALRDLAIWQLDNIRWHQQAESQLEQLRGLRDPSEAELQSKKDAALSR